VALGCVCIEKHFTLDRDLKESDYFSSLNPDELIKFVKLVRESEIVMGSPSFEMSPEEITYRELLKKSIYTSTEIKKGELFSSANLCFKRSLEADRILSDQYNLIEGKVALCDIGKNARLTKQMISNG
jgi:N,N'-diacetyllegionaminate synthase